MKWYWTWSGKCFGYRDGDDLRTYEGYHVGKFYGDEAYGSDGRYLGEVMNDQFLITCKSKKGWRKSGFTPYAKYAGYAKYANYAAFAMYAGHEDFPEPEALR
jgi:hypothetical protein